jgi:glucokinase
MSDEAATVLGIDIGGTKMAAAIVSADGEILTKDLIRTLPGGAD